MAAQLSPGQLCKSLLYYWSELIGSGYSKSQATQAVGRDFWVVQKFVPGVHHHDQVAGCILVDRFSHGIDVI